MSPLLARHALWACALCAGLVLGCVTAGGSAMGDYAYFGTPGAQDAWSPKIGEWQARALQAGTPGEGDGPASVSGPGSEEPVAASAGGLLRAKFESFRKERRRELAHQVADWIQQEARAHYLPDGPVDHWATLEETLLRGAEDCDGLELLAHQLLLEMGFSEEEVFRAIVFRPEDGQHHMVTFWFEDRNDPWVIDPTGAMTTGMPLMSELPEWVPVKVFDTHREYTVRRHAGR